MNHAIAAYRFRRSLRPNHGEWNSDALDELARQQRERLEQQGALDPNPRRIFKLRCQACTILIGPGHHATNVWCDSRTHRLICQGCALWSPKTREHMFEIATSDEVATLSIGDLSRTLRQRVRDHKRRRARS